MSAPLPETVLARRRRAARALVVLCALAHVAGLAGLYALPMHFASKTYVSENALQPGTHTTTLASGRLASELHTQLAGYNASRAWVQTQLSRAHIECHAVALASGVHATVGFVRSSRATPAGCALVSAHYESPISVAYAVRLAGHLAASKAVGRDVLFLFTSNASDAITPWMQHYYSEQTTGPLFRHSGPIQQALHLDFGPMENGVANKVAVALEGPQLPNLDLLNAFVQTCARHGIDRRSFATARRFSHPLLKRLPGPAAFFAQFFINQFVGGSGSHAAFNAFAADSMTISTLGGGRGSVTMDALSNCIEGTMRSILSLQEPLHQSFYFYLLPSATQYVSIGDYMIVFAMLLAVVPVAMAVIVIDPQFDKSTHAPTVGVAVPVALLSGALLWRHWSVTVYAVVVGVASVAVVSVAALSPLASDYSAFLLSFGAMCGALIVCSLVSFPIATIGATLTVLHLLCWWLAKNRSRFVAFPLYALLDPLALLFAVNQAMGRAGLPAVATDAAWFAWMCLAYVPFRVSLCAALWFRANEQ